jgi:hypothetical protein
MVVGADIRYPPVLPNAFLRLEAPLDARPDQIDVTACAERVE